MILVMSGVTSGIGWISAVSYSATMTYSVMGDE